MHDEPRLLRWHLRLLSERYYTRHLLVEDVIDLCHTYNHNTHVVVALAALIFVRNGIEKGSFARRLGTVTKFSLGRLR